MRFLFILRESLEKVWFGKMDGGFNGDTVCRRRPYNRVNLRGMVHKYMIMVAQGVQSFKFFAKYYKPLLPLNFNKFKLFSFYNLKITKFIKIRKVWFRF